VIRDPQDGNYYLHIDPLDFEKYSAEDLKKLQERYAEDVAERMISSKEKVEPF
jgi:lipoate-protein ligase A